MKPTLRLLAQASSAGSTNAGLRPALALLPPIPLYRRLFRAHRRHLPREMRLLGDEYIRAEFRSHRETENPAHIVSLSFSVGTAGWGGGERLKTLGMNGFLDSFPSTGQLAYLLSV